MNIVVKCTKDLVSQWPFNLLYEITNNDIHNTFSMNIIELYEEISVLNDQEQKLIGYRYKDHMTYKDIAALMELTPAKTSKFTKEVVAKLRNRVYNDCVMLTISRIKFDTINSDYIKLKAELELMVSDT